MCFLKFNFFMDSSTPFYFWIFFSIVAIKLFGFFIATLMGMSTVGLPAKRSIPPTAISCAMMTTSAAAISSAVSLFCAPIVPCVPDLGLTARGLRCVLNLFRNDIGMRDACGTSCNSYDLDFGFTSHPSLFFWHDHNLSCCKRFSLTTAGT